MTEQELYTRRLTNDYNDILTKYYRLCEEYRQLEEKYTEQKNFLDKLCERGIIELRYNPYHDPTNGRFTTADSSGWGLGGALVVEKGQKGKGTYVFSSELFDKNFSGTHSFSELTDSENLTESQINAINMQRYDVWQGAAKYSRETKPLSPPNLTPTQQTAFSKAWYDNDYSAIEKSSLKTKQALAKQAEYEYDTAQRQIAKGNYHVENDFFTNRNGKRVAERFNFPDAYNARNKASHIINVLSETKGVINEGREITSSSYKQAMSRLSKQADGWLSGRSLDNEERYNPNHDSNGRFSSGGAGGTKYAPSPRANSGGITLKTKTFVKVRGEFNTRYPNAAEGFVGRVTKGKYNYRCKADGLGSIIVINRTSIK